MSIALWISVILLALAAAYSLRFTGATLSLREPAFRFHTTDYARTYTSFSVGIGIRLQCGVSSPARSIRQKFLVKSSVSARQPLNRHARHDRPQSFNTAK
jgi:hypothetical protein